MVSLSLEWFFVGQPGAARKRCAVRLLHMDNVGVRAMANCVPDDISSLSGRAAEAAAASGATEAGHASHAGERRDANRRRHVRRDCALTGCMRDGALFGLAAAVHLPRASAGRPGLLLVRAGFARVVRRRFALPGATRRHSAQRLPPSACAHPRPCAGRTKHFRMRNESADVCRFSITRRLMTH